MNKGLGAATFGAVLLAGFLFEVKHDASPSANLQSTASSQSATKPLTGEVPSEGPWIASCRYWAAAHSVDSPADGGVSPDLGTTVNTSGKGVVSHSEPASTSGPPCGPGDTWGIPKTTTPGPEPRPEISAIVATVPDPIHSHLALDFDRAIDAILVAAADNGYLSSYYWLPWRTHASSLPSGESVSNPASHDDNSQNEPGLIILRYAPDPNYWRKENDDLDPEKHSFSRAAYYRVVYIFLVGETPALGVNGVQLRNAFKYEKYLRENHDAWLSVRPPPFAEPDKAATQIHSNPDSQGKNILSVIGPFFSGSAASLHQAIEAVLPDLSTGTEPVRPSISGVTSTMVSVRELDPRDQHIYRSFGENASWEQERFLQSLACSGYDLSRVAVLSEAGTVFGAATKVTESSSVAEPSSTSSSAVPCKNGSSNSEKDITRQGTILNLRFPRELSLLRNAEPTQTGASDASAPPTPYLNLSLKDTASGDTVPRFSTAQSPLSLEAQLMAIAHQIQRSRIQFVLLSASNILDDIFLAQFLLRACPDARLVLFTGGDLLFERDVDNQPYIGSLSISPYLLTTLDFGNEVQWLHSDYQSEAIYNATSYTFWNRSVEPAPTLAGYRRYPVPNYSAHSKAPPPAPQFLQIPLWATVLGSDGYYPLAILDWCGSNRAAILPTIQLRDPSSQPEQKCDDQQTATVNSGWSQTNTQHLWDFVPESINRNSGISPSLVWMVVDTFILALCLLHIALLWSANFWSPSTRDLAVDQNDQPHRRSVYLNIGTSVLAAMAVVTAYPLILVGQYYHLALPGHLFAWLAIIAASAACLSTVAKTWPYRYHHRCVEYTFFNLVAALALIFTTVFWIAICRSDNLNGQHHSYAGLYFSYRCLQPFSGVCPLFPILLLLLAWYLWSICQTARLRFSELHRPRIARQSPPTADYHPSDAPYPLYVPDDALERHERPIDCCLYENMTCLLITREVIRRFGTNLSHDSRGAARALAAWVGRNVDYILAAIYLFLFILCIFASHIHSLDNFLFTTHHGPTLYEFLIGTLFFPLIMVALSGWFRAILIWGALRRGLLEPLERLPIRFAFTRFRGVSWISMLSESGLHIRWRDMGRSTEAIRQLVHHPDVASDPDLKGKLSPPYEAINAKIRQLLHTIHPAGDASPDGNLALGDAPVTPSVTTSYQPSDFCLIDGWDCPRSDAATAELCTILAIEEGYATFCGALLNFVLTPYWDKVRTGLVEESDFPAEPEAKSGEAPKPQKTEAPAKPDNPNKPPHFGAAFIHLAEELMVVRYVALIRAVLVNMRYLMLFVSAAFVLTIISWNSYPFQPHRLIDWCFTFLFIFISIGFVVIFAQMHRNPLLSRITDTAPNELGVDFYLRLATFGAVPVLTWLAYQFPGIGGNLFRILKPGLQVLK
jgi:hypothetical protein